MPKDKDKEDTGKRSWGLSLRKGGGKGGSLKAQKEQKARLQKTGSLKDYSPSLKGSDSDGFGSPEGTPGTLRRRLTRKETKFFSAVEKATKRSGGVGAFSRAEVGQIWTLLFPSFDRHSEIDSSQVEASAFAGVFEHRMGERSNCEAFFIAYFQGRRSVPGTEFFTSMILLRQLAQLTPGEKQALPAAAAGFPDILETLFTAFDSDKKGHLSPAQIAALSRHLVFVQLSKLPSIERSDAEVQVDAIVQKLCQKSSSSTDERTISRAAFCDKKEPYHRDLLERAIARPLFAYDVSETFSLFAKGKDVAPLSEETKAAFRLLSALAHRDEAFWRPAAEHHHHSSSAKKISAHDQRHHAEDAAEKAALIAQALALINDAKTNLEATNVSGNSLLHYAVMCHSVPEILDALLEKGSSSLAFRRGPSGVTPIHVAASAGSDGALKKLADACKASRSASSRFNSVQDDAGLTPLSRAIQVMGSKLNTQKQAASIISCIAFLLKQGADIHALDVDACTPLHVAARSGNADVIPLLLAAPQLTSEDDRKAYMMSSSNGRFTPLHWAANNGHPKVCQLLVQAGANVRAENMAKQTPIHLAAAAGAHVCIDKLIPNTDEDGAEVVEDGMTALCALQDSMGNTPLHAATYGRFELTAQLLIRLHPESLKIPDNSGRVPTNLARSLGKSYAKIATLLAESPLHKLTPFSKEILAKFRAGDSKGVIKMLKEDPDADVLAANENGTTLLQYAAMRGREDIAKELLARGSDPNWPNNRGTRPIHKCAQYGTIDVLKLLAAQDRVDLDLQDDEGMTAVHRGLRELGATLANDSDKKRGSPKAIRDCLEFLYVSKSALGIRDASGANALDIAASLGLVDQIEMLIRYGAEVNAFNHETTRTALHFAIEAGQEACALILLEHHIDIALGDPMKHCIVRHPSLSMFELLLGHVNDKSKNQIPLLHWAAQSSDSALFDLVLQQFPTGVGLQDTNGNIPLHFARTAAAVDALYEVPKASSSQHEVCNAAGHTPLDCCVQNPSIPPETASAMIARGASATVQHLYLAAKARNSSVCQYFLSTGIKYDVSSDKSLLNDMPEAPFPMLIDFEDLESGEGSPTGFPVVKCATVRKLFDHWVNPRYFDETFSRALLLGYPGFVEPDILLRFLLERIVEGDDCRNVGPLVALGHWLEFQFDDFVLCRVRSLADGTSEPYTLGDILLDAIKSDFPRSVAESLQSMYNRLLREFCQYDFNMTANNQESEDNSDSSVDDSYLTGTGSRDLLFKHSATTWAAALTYFDSHTARHVNAREFRGQAWTKGEEAAVLAPTLTRVISRFNCVSKWVKSVILSGDSAEALAASSDFVSSAPKIRAKAISKFAEIAVECLALNNLSSAVAICSALDNSAISRLAKTWEFVPSKTHKALAAPRELTSPLGNFKCYRKTLANAAAAVQPRVPFMAPVLQDLTFADEGNELFEWRDKKSPDRALDFVINFEKCSMEERIIYDGFLKHVKQGIAPAYDSTLLDKIPPGVRSFVDNFPPGYDETEEYARSLKLEPRQ